MDKCYVLWAKCYMRLAVPHNIVTLLYTLGRIDIHTGIFLLVALALPHIVRYCCQRPCLLALHRQKQ